MERSEMFLLRRDVKCVCVRLKVMSQVVARCVLSATLSPFTLLSMWPLVAGTASKRASANFEKTLCWQLFHTLGERQPQNSIVAGPKGKVISPSRCLLCLGCHRRRHAGSICVQNLHHLHKSRHSQRRDRSRDASCIAYLRAQKVAKPVSSKKLNASQRQSHINMLYTI